MCLEIDGVLSPPDQDNSGNLHAPTPGIVYVPGAGHTLQAHPALPTWTGELEQPLQDGGDPKGSIQSDGTGGNGMCQRENATSSSGASGR